jgi:superfamily II DNA/RNA helicase
MADAGTVFRDTKSAIAVRTGFEKMRLSKGMLAYVNKKFTPHEQPRARPTASQAVMLPVLLDGKDCVIQTPTSSGKTTSKRRGSRVALMLTGLCVLAQ